jgi:rhamnosyltransferase
MTTGEHSKRVDAVVVAYQPEVAELRELLVSLSRQVDHIHLVDNTAAIDNRVVTLLNELRCSNITLLRLGDNLGMAKALNVGIASGRAAGATHMLLSDQDSLPAPDMVARLLQAHDQLLSCGAVIGAIGPTFTDIHTNTTLPFQTQIKGRRFYVQAQADAGSVGIEVLTLITSGCLIPIEVFDRVGGMCEDYFIDFVDTEWCHRARNHGYALYGTALARMEHRVGEGIFQVWFGRWKNYTRYSPLRLRYRFRNAVFLLGSEMVTWRWKLRSTWTWLGDAYANVLFAPGRMRNLIAILQGIRDGLFGRGGRIDQ